MTDDRVAQLVFILRSILAENPTWVQRLGQIDISKGKFWVEFKFPDGPPLEYEKPGIELTDKLEWRKATRPVEFHHHHRLTRLLYPQAAASALYKDTTKKTRGLWNHFRAYMGWHQESKADTVEQLVQRIAADAQSSDTQPASTTPGPTSTSATDSQQPGISSSTVSIDGPPKDLSLLPDTKKMTLDLSQFRADFRKASRTSLAQPPRGVFSIIGLVEVHGDRAKGSFSVNAIYDPKKGTFFHVHAAAWNVTEHKQRPIGG
ncbi:hypothetical protein GMOD_00002063 [Pyrenophora seminiperda CCB06]|uniref:Uncharacterized protein n=1 Tax=Pyrenophora seminiperda CCB06 TaxID=1302712 RepID=A0A3M7LWS7_9PLEO|nr:hypothetical protein GMOD_00002063 [Pyrenophora seminiperda CCB06]